MPTVFDPRMVQLIPEWALSRESWSLAVKTVFGGEWTLNLSVLDPDKKSILLLKEEIEKLGGRAILLKITPVVEMKQEKLF